MCEKVCGGLRGGLHYDILHYVRFDQIRLDETLIISVTLMISMGIAESLQIRFFRKQAVSVCVGVCVSAVKSQLYT